MKEKEEVGSDFSTSTTHFLKCFHLSQFPISEAKGREPLNMAYRITPQDQESAFTPSYLLKIIIMMMKTRSRMGICEVENPLERRTSGAT